MFEAKSNAHLFGIPLPLDYNPDVLSAQKKNQPVVAIETSYITHWEFVDWTDNKKVVQSSMIDVTTANLKLARDVEEAVRETDATPAHIAIINGKIKIGLTDDEQAELRDNYKDCMKLDKRDIGMCLMTKKYGVTTLACAISLAHVAGISVVATQVIGGVGPINNYNLSADVMELGKTPVAVVCSGSIMDAAKTMEVLETQGVNVCATNSDNLAGICKIDSGIKANLRCDDVEELSRYIFTQFSLLGLNTGYVVSNPVNEAHVTNAIKFDQYMKDILLTVNDKIPFRDLKLWMFNKLDELSEGKACVSLKAILYSNAILASRIASNLCKMSQNDDGYWNTDLYRQSHIIAKHSQSFGNMPMKFNKSPQKLQSPTKGKKIKALLDTTISLDQLHVNKGKSPFEDSLYNKPADGSAQDQMLKLKARLHVDKTHHKRFDDHDEHEKERMDHCAHWGSKRDVINLN